MPTKGPWEAFAVQELPDDIPSLLASGAKYYAQLVRRYHGDTEKARAAYNFGMRNVDKGLPYPKETRDYIIKTNPSSASPPSIPPAPNATLAQASPPPGPWAAFAESPAPKPTGGSTGQALGL